MARDVRVHVATFNTAAATELCIRTIRKFAGHPYDLVVGDSGSTDGSLERLKGFEHDGWLELEEAPGGRRHAEWLDHWLAECPSRYAVFVDSDMEFLRAGWLADLVQVAERDGATLVTSRIHFDERSYVNPKGAPVRWAPRPTPWLMLVDVAKARTLHNAGFGYCNVEDPDRAGGRLAYDTAAYFYAQLLAHDMTVSTMPDDWPSCYRHFGGMTWIRLRPATRLRRRAKQAMKGAHIHYRLGLARLRAR
ncbi:MAG TPA: glycosyltransferase [Acidimicrobiia bacterium]|jgi:glycosyltransferase involved in cell wall biosynthesis